MDKQNIFNLISEQTFIEKFDALIEAISKASGTSTSTIELVPDPEHPDKYIIMANGVNVTEQMSATVITDDTVDKLKEDVTPTWDTF